MGMRMIINPNQPLCGIGHGITLRRSSVCCQNLCHFHCWILGAHVSFLPSCSSKITCRENAELTVCRMPRRLVRPRQFADLTSSQLTRQNTEAFSHIASDFHALEPRNPH